MQHVVIFPAWACQLRCEYCSIRHSYIDRTVPPVEWQAWAKALPAVLQRGSVVDIAGGEPLLYTGIVELLHALGRAGLRWAVTTNGKAQEVVKRIAAEKPIGGICFNVSDHAGNPEAPESVAALRGAGYLVNTHRVDHPAAGHRLADAVTITYQPWKEGAAVDGITRRCSAGVHHWVADPRGDLWRCVVALETGQPSVGNLFTRQVQRGEALCGFGCTACYTEDPASWQIEMETIGGKD